MAFETKNKLYENLGAETHLEKAFAIEYEIEQTEKLLEAMKKELEKERLLSEYIVNCGNCKHRKVDNRNIPCNEGKRKYTCELGMTGIVHTEDFCSQGEVDSGHIEYKEGEMK